MSGSQPKRQWAVASIGTVERAHRPTTPSPEAPLAVKPSLFPPPLVIEAGITFKTTCVGDVGAAALRVPETREGQEAKARKALWRYIHDGLDEPLFDTLLSVRKAAACTSPVDPARHHLNEAVKTLQTLIDHVLGNEGELGPDGWVNEGFLGKAPFPDDPPKLQRE